MVEEVRNTIGVCHAVKGRGCGRIPEEWEVREGWAAEEKLFITVGATEKGYGRQGNLTPSPTLGLPRFLYHGQLCLELYCRFGSEWELHFRVMGPHLHAVEAHWDLFGEEGRRGWGGGTFISRGRGKFDSLPYPRVFVERAVL